MWNVTTLRPLNSGRCGNTDANMRPTLCPTRVEKLFKMSSGKWFVARPWFLIFLVNTSDESRYRHVGPSGRCTCSRPFTRAPCENFLFSLNTSTSVKPRVSACFWISCTVYARRA